MRRLWCAVLGFWLAWPLQGSPAWAQGLERMVDSAFSALARDDAPGCVVGVRHGAEEIQRAYGMANLEYGVPLRPESVLESGSVAKQFTAAAVVLLALEGKLSLDDDVRRYLPEVPDFGRTITLRQMLHHTSGLRDQWGLLSLAGSPPGSVVHTIPLILHLVSRQRMLNFLPGEEYLYSNTNYSLLGVVVARVSRQSLAVFTTERFFEPLGMTRTQWREDYRTVVPDRATAYERQGDAWIQDMPFTMVHGNGGLLTTVGDLLRWNEALTAGTIVGGKALVRLLETPGRLNDGSTIDYALGLGVSTFHGARQIAHTGSTAGYRAYLARWPQAGLSVAALCNAANANPAGRGRHVASGILGPFPAEAPPGPIVHPSRATLQALAGVYRDSTTDQFVQFAVRGDTLTVSGGGAGAPLVPLAGNRYWSAVAGEYEFESRGDHWRVVTRPNGLRIYEPYVPPDTSALDPQEFAGFYQSPELDLVFEVRPERGRLLLIKPPTPLPALAPLYPDGFRAGGYVVRFTRDSAGQVNGFRIFAGRVRDLRFSRIPPLSAPRGDRDSDHPS